MERKKKMKFRDYSQLVCLCGFVLGLVSGLLYPKVHLRVALICTAFLVAQVFTLGIAWLYVKIK